MPTSSQVKLRQAGKALVLGKCITQLEILLAGLYFVPIFFVKSRSFVPGEKREYQQTEAHLIPAFEERMSLHPALKFR